MAHVITDATFEQETSQGLVLIDFWATWCGPCRMQAPILDQLAEEVHEDDLKICKMDVDENPNTARQFGIMSITSAQLSRAVKADEISVVEPTQPLRLAVISIKYRRLDNFSSFF